MYIRLRILFEEHSCAKTWTKFVLGKIWACTRLNILEPWWFLLHKKDCFVGRVSYYQTESARTRRYSDKQVIIQSLSTAQDLLGFNPLSKPASRDLSAFLKVISIAELARQIRCLKQRILLCGFWESTFKCFPAARMGDGNKLANVIWE